MEKDDEVKGAASSLTTEFRQYDSRLGRWLTLDPIGVAFESPYAAFRNNPIVYNDQNGDCPDCNGFTTPAGKLMYASNKHYLWDQKGELVETADGVVHRINAQGINYLWDQKLEGYYDSKGEKYSNPDSSWYDGLVLGFSEMGIGKRAVYYSTKDGFEKEMPLKIFSNILGKNAIEKGKNSDFEYIKIDLNDSFIWVNNRSTMESIWNVVIWLENLV